MYSTREDVENWLNQMGIKNYVINEDLTVDVNRDVNISYKNLREIPIKFGVVNGYFYCNNNKLTSLKGCPKKVSENFYCQNNELTSLEFMSEVINGGFYCQNNKLSSLKGCLEIINGSFNCSNNGLTDFKYFPKEINSEYIFIDKNKIKEELLFNFNFNCNINLISEIYSDFNENGNKEKFLEKVNYYKSKRENELLKELSVKSNNIKLNKKL